MTPTRAQEFAETWNGGDAARVASYLAEDGFYHASVGPEPLGASFVGRAEIERGVAAVAAWCPGGRFESRRVTVAGTIALVVRSAERVSNQEAGPRSRPLEAWFETRLWRSSP